MVDESADVDGRVRVLEGEMAELSLLSDHPNNYREHPDDQLEHIMQSIHDHGVYRNIVVARDGTILAGHGVVKALRKMDTERAPVIRLDLDPFDPRALKVLAGDNEIGHLGIVDDRKLTNLLKGIKDQDEVLLGTGFDEMMLANLTFITRSQSEITDFDAAAHWVGMPDFEPGTKSVKLSISFSTEEDRLNFLERMGIVEDDLNRKYSLGTWSMWWPPRKFDDTISLRYEEGEND